MIYQGRVNFPWNIFKSRRVSVFLRRKGVRCSSTLNRARWSWATKKWVGEKNDWIPSTSQFYFHSWKVVNTISIMTRRSEAEVAAPRGVNITDAAAHTPQNQSETVLLLATDLIRTHFRKRPKKNKTKKTSKPISRVSMQSHFETTSLWWMTQAPKKLSLFHMIHWWEACRRRSNTHDILEMVRDSWLVIRSRTSLKKKQQKVIIRRRLRLCDMGLQT